MFISVILSVLVMGRAQVKTNLYSAPEKSAVVIDRKPTSKASASVPKASAGPSGNLPQDLSGAGGTQSGAIIIPSIKTPNTYSKIKPGEVFEAEIPETVIALPDQKVMVRALIKRGAHIGSFLLGEASLEANTKRVTITFSRIRPNGGEDIYDLEAAALDLSGALGIEGEYNSQELKLFSAEFFLHLVSGWSDASISRDKNAWGTYQDVPGPDTQTKKAVGEATSKAAERFADKVRSAPAYSIVHGPTLVQVMVIR